MIGSMLDVLAIDGWTLLLLASIAFAAAVISGMSGMGGGLIVSIVITPLIGVQALVPTISLAMLMAHVARVWVYRHDVRWREAALVIAVAVPTAIAGSSFYAALTSEAIGAVIGVFLLLSVPARRYLQKRSFRLNAPGLLACSAGFGFVSGTTLGGGLLIIPVLMSAGLLGMHLIATDAVIGLSVLIAKTTTYGQFSLLDARLTLFGVLIGLCMIPGTYVASWLVRRTGIRLHTLLMEAVIVIGGLGFLWRAVTGSGS
jgi:uncharacterized membrane protein YfcA